MSLFPKFRPEADPLATPATPPPQSSKSSDSSSLGDGRMAYRRPARLRYHEVAEALADDCFAIDPVWLIERHPELWCRLVSLDIQAMQVERLDTAGEAYQRVLRDIVAKVQNIRVLYETEQSRLPSVQ